MKTADIEVGRAYVAKLDYGAERVKVTALEAGLARSVGYGRDRKIRKDRVRVRVEEEIVRYGRVRFALGSEETITARDVARRWTEEDDAVRAEAQEAEARRDAIADRLISLGLVRYDAEERLDLIRRVSLEDYEAGTYAEYEFDFDFYGEDLRLTPRGTERLLAKAGL